jgi:hypothetical protein
MSTETKTRFVKCVKGTYSDVKDDKLTAKINRQVHIINEHGGKIISFSNPTVIGVGMSTVYLVMQIIYEATEEIPSEAFKEKSGK